MTYILIGLGMTAWGLLMLVESPVKYPPKPIKEREEPQFTKEFTEWQKHIKALRNAKN